MSEASADRVYTRTSKLNTTSKNESCMTWEVLRWWWWYSCQEALHLDPSSFEGFEETRDLLSDLSNCLVLQNELNDFEKSLNVMEFRTADLQALREQLHVSSPLPADS